ncbi:DUF1599 domain-containing protein [Bacteroidota bacterium]
MVSERTTIQYSEQAAKARSVFINKNKDYGTSWRILRLPSLIDQIYIKTDRIRNIEEGKIPLVEDNTSSEYLGIINYCLITLMQMELGKTSREGSDFEEVIIKYDYYLEEAKKLMQRKNHDYGEAWRNMYISSYTDLILTKILRIKQILENDGHAQFSEGIDANLYDMINYSFFALIKLSENNEAN